uniref:Secreted protein n=1 Tax=Steinernema glaseri TaxID=37863 RepID=A0A1I8A5A4_9BILA
MNFLLSSVLLLACIWTVNAALFFYPAKVGEKVVLDLGTNIRTWVRTIGENTTEAIIKCEGNLVISTPKCSGWRNMATNKLTPSKDYVGEDGQLIIASYQESVAGQYGSPDEPMRVEVVEGGYAMLPRTAINLFTKND